MDYTDYSDCGLVVAVDLVNTLDVADETDELSDPEALRRFLEERGVSGVRAVTQADLEAVRALRGRLRQIFTGEQEAAAVAEINALLRESGALPQLTDHDGDPWHLHFTPPEAALAVRLAAETAMGLAVVVRDDGLRRLRVCAGEGCADVFVDTSRNRSRRYCSAAACGNRAHVAAYRARRRTSADG